MINYTIFVSLKPLFSKIQWKKNKNQTNKKGAQQKFVSIKMLFSQNLIKKNSMGQNLDEGKKRATIPPNFN